MKKLSILLMSLLAPALLSQAQETLSVDDVTIYQGAETQLVVNMNLDANHSYIGYQMTVELPQGVMLVSDEYGQVQCELSEGQPAAVFNVDFPMASSILKVYSSPSTVISGHEGMLVSFPIIAADDLAAGQTLQGKLTGVVLSRYDNDGQNVESVSVDFDDVTFNIQVATDVVMLDEQSVKMPVTTSDPVKVSVRRTIAADQWETLVLPFAMTGEQLTTALGSDVSIRDFSGWEVLAKDDDDEPTAIRIALTPVAATDGIEANHPYFVKVSQPVSLFQVDGVIIAPVESPSKVVGKGSKQGKLVGTYLAGTTVPEESLWLDGGNFAYSYGATALLGYRAYLNLGGVLIDYYSEEDVRKPIHTKDFEEDGVTICTESYLIGSSITQHVTRAPEAGQLYDLQGRQVAAPRNGVYIRDRKKVVVK